MENTQSDIDFIMTDLLPEMVYNRCFCDPNSREFVEFESANIHQSKKNNINSIRKLYKGQVIVQFSGEPKVFSVIIKLLPNDQSPSNYNDDIYGYFLNEEMFYNKIIKKYKLDIYPKCFVADMGKYGRPVIVLEDLESFGYHNIHEDDDKLDEDHLNLLVKSIAKFHGRGMKIKRDEFNDFREFYAKLVTPVSNDDYIKTINKAFNDLKDNLTTDLAQKWYNKIENTSLIMDHQFNKFITICHGCFNKEHWLFKYDNNNKPIDIKILGWNNMIYTNVIYDLKFILEKFSDNLNFNKIHDIFHEYFCNIIIEYNEQSNEKLYLGTCLKST
ncbi:uncharacterized protein LOC122853505 [Aphidius gifuensis]|uniref:uncharacterized protein LOC122853505 n=1 Tax=Aphidius gifuensis TaxID=684658 RepID=UPI001CDC5055|nr:uncharacterized protein LOC122853505 [Aphidius gifuensis]